MTTVDNTRAKIVVTDFYTKSPVEIFIDEIQSFTCKKPESYVEIKLDKIVWRVTDHYSTMGELIRVAQKNDVLFVTEEIETKSPRISTTIVKPAGFVHSDLMLEYAMDAKKNNRPWSMWQYRESKESMWKWCSFHPEWKNDYEYRKNLKIITSIEMYRPTGDIIQTGNSVTVSFPSVEAATEFKQQMERTK